MYVFQSQYMCLCMSIYVSMYGYVFILFPDNVFSQLKPLSVKSGHPRVGELREKGPPAWPRATTAVESQRSSSR